MRNNRSVDFVDDFKENGALYFFAKKVKENDNLELCFRGNDNAVNIYCNNLLVWKIYGRSNGYKVVVSLHKSVPQIMRDKIANDLKKEGFISFDGKGEIHRYPWITKPIFDECFVDKTYKILIPMIDKYFEDGKHKEKRMQQELFRHFDDYKKGLYIYDLELQEKGESKKGQNLSDMIAVRFEGNEAKALTLIEVKSDRQACADRNSGITAHLEGMWSFINDGKKMKDKKEEAFDIITQYKTLHIRKTPDEIENIKRIDKYEMIMILTDKAIDYYKEDPKDKIKTLIKEKQIKCEFYGWDGKRLELLR